MGAGEQGRSAPGGAGSPNATGCVYDPVFLKHATSGHPERPERLEASVASLREAGLWDSLQPIPARPATADEITSVHPLSHLEHARAVSRAGGGYLDPDTYMNCHSYEAALAAVGGLIDLVLAVAEGKLANGFALVRPPGHHATVNQAMGFCIFSNVAIAAKAAQLRGGLQRVAIVDFDVHHGNGTQDVFVRDPRTLYVSTHQFPHYPGSGRLEEIGEGEGKGTTLNLPLPAGVGDDGFRVLYEKILAPALERFQPQLLLVSAGYDAHWADPLAGLSLTLSGYAWLSQRLVFGAEKLCAGKVVFALEGGYDLEVLRTGICNSVKALLGRDDFDDPLGKAQQAEPDLSQYIPAVKKLHGLGD